MLNPTVPTRSLPCRAPALLLLLALTLLSGCSYFRQKAAARYVYVTARQVFLRDRVAAVSNRTGSAVNGEKLVVLDRTRRAIKVRTARGEVGWIEEKLTADQKTADLFSALEAAHKNDPIVANATAQYEGYLHASPGRETPFFYRVAEGDTLALLERATVPRNPPTPPPAHTSRLAPNSPAESPEKPESLEKEPAREVTPQTEAAPLYTPPPPVLEDWWLVRNAKGQTGWILSRRIDVSVPDVVVRYAEGQRVVGSYVLATVTDPDSGLTENGAPVTAFPEYVTLLSASKAGLPYDFDQVRVFIWNLKKHRYETGFREAHILGYLPLTLGHTRDPYSPGALAQMDLPSFTYKVLPASSPVPTPDPVTGLLDHGPLLSKTYRLEGNICRRIVAPGTPNTPEAHPIADTPQGKSKKKRKG